VLREPLLGFVERVEEDMFPDGRQRSWRLERQGRARTTCFLNLHELARAPFTALNRSRRKKKRCQDANLENFFFADEKGFSPPLIFPPLLTISPSLLLSSLSLSRIQISLLEGSRIK
jgi:hypothetical protein